jgi:hypothetical protein
MGGSQPDGFWDAVGLAGCRPNGEIHAGTTVDFNAGWIPQGLKEPRESFFYTYSIDMNCDSGGYCSGPYGQGICDGCAARGLPCPNGTIECCWGNHYPSDPDPNSVFPRDEWICLETMMELNTPNVSDGRMAYWINDELIHEETTMYWRIIPELQLNRAALQHYIAPDDPHGDHSNRVWWDNTVISTERIGCLGFSPQPTCHDVNNDAAVNIIDLVLVIFHQGIDNNNPNWPDYDHLDVNEDTMINFGDVSSVISSFGQSC